MDIFVKKAIIHQFSPDDTELVLADQLLTVSPKIEEYLRKKIERVFSDEAKTGQFNSENPFLDHLKGDLLSNSVKIANLWKEEFSISLIASSPSVHLLSTLISSSSEIKSDTPSRICELSSAIIILILSCIIPYIYFLLLQICRYWIFLYVGIFLIFL